MPTTPIRANGWPVPSTRLKGGMSPGDKVARKLRLDEGSGQEGGQQQEVDENSAEEFRDVTIPGVVGNSLGGEYAVAPLEYGEEEQYLEEALEAELAKAGRQIDVQVCSDDSQQAKGADNCSKDDLIDHSKDDLNNYSKDDLNNYSKDDLNNYSKGDLNNSILLSDKFDIRMSEDGDAQDDLINLNNSILLSEKFEMSMSDLSDELFIEDLTEAERELEESIGSRALSKIDPHYYSSPRLVMRGEYVGDVINLKVKRKPMNGTYVDWYMMNKETKDIILNVKAEMTYSYDLHGVRNRAKKDGADDGASYSMRVPSGRIWYGYVSLMLINVLHFTLLHVWTGMDMGS